jgi:hypothetical protein
MSAVRSIRPETEVLQCAVCGRRLLLGETPETYLHGGQRRTVCELCTTRANREGWIRESAGLQLGARSRRDDRVPLFERLRSRRQPREQPPQERQPEPEAELTAEPEAELTPEQTVERAAREPEPEPAAPAPAPREPRHVHAVPTSDELKTQRAMELFNVSEHPRVVSGVARSLGAPGVAVRALVDQPSRVIICVSWELCWYRFEVDLADEGDHVVSKAGQGYELTELDEADRIPNAVADEFGRLALAA